MCLTHSQRKIVPLEVGVSDLTSKDAGFLVKFELQVKKKKRIILVPSIA